MGIGDLIRSALGRGPSMDVRDIDLPLSGESADTLNNLISRGVFRNKNDFLSFAAKTYMRNNLGATLSGGNQLTESMVLGVVNKTSIGRSLDDNTKRMLVPLLIMAFTAIYRHMTRRREAARPT